MGNPDTCLTPAPPGPPIPVPYPNTSMCTMAVPPTTAMNVLLTAGPAHNIMTMVPMSQGDNAGLNMGVMSGMVMGPTRWLKGSMKVMMGGKPAVRLTDMTGHNGASMNVPGNTIAPSQQKVMIMG